MDQQVKIRGFRIELSEVESVLGCHPAVVEAVVEAREDVPGDKRLVAYVVLAGEGGVTDGELRDFLQRKLPGYMVPAVFVRLGKLPLDPNGKVDRQALPAPQRGCLDLQDGFVAPRTAVEELLAGIWCEVLGIESVGVHDNFFELGGNSLSVTRIVSQVNDFFQVQLPLRSFFESPTIDGLSQSLTKICGCRETLSRRIVQLVRELEQISEDDVE
jgi:acyl carrier protein